MSLAEIKKTIDRLSPEERNELQAYLWEKAGVPIYYSSTVDQRMKEMDEGKFVAWDDIRDEVIKREELPDEN